MYTSRKSNGSKSFHVITQSKKQKRRFSINEKKNNNKTEMQAICFKDEQAYLNTAGIKQSWGQELHVYWNSCQHIQWLT